MFFAFFLLPLLYARHVVQPICTLFHTYDFGGNGEFGGDGNDNDDGDGDGGGGNGGGDDGGDLVMMM